MTDKVYLRKRGDNTNLIEVDANTIKVIFDGKKEWFTKHQITRVQLKDIREPFAMSAGVIMGVIGALLVNLNLIMSLVTITAGAVAFHFGMQWHRRLLIHLDCRMVYKLTFFHRSVRDIHSVLVKHGYIEKGKFPWLT